MLADSPPSVITCLIFCECLGYVPRHSAVQHSAGGRYRQVINIFMQINCASRKSILRLKQFAIDEPHETFLQMTCQTFLHSSSVICLSERVTVLDNVCLRCLTWPRVIYVYQFLHIRNISRLFGANETYLVTSSVGKVNL